MANLMVVAPADWRPLVDALVQKNGTETTHSVLGGRPSYSCYDAFLRAQKERMGFAMALQIAQTGAADVVKALDANGAPENLRKALDALPENLQVAYTLRRMLEMLHEHQPLGVLVSAGNTAPIDVTVAASGEALGIPVVRLSEKSEGDYTRVVQDIVEAAGGAKATAPAV